MLVLVVGLTIAWMADLLPPLVLLLSLVSLSALVPLAFLSALVSAVVLLLPLNHLRASSLVLSIVDVPSWLHLPIKMDWHFDSLWS